MVNFPGRSDRRRRVLKEEVLSATNSHAVLRTETSGASAQAPRYSDAAGVENHPQITDFVPRHYGTIALLLLFGVASTGLAAATHYLALPMAASRGMTSAAAFDLAARGNLAAWLAAVVLFLTSGFCVITYSIRRHRIDDFHGRYRAWLFAALAGLVLSANSVAGLHQVLADALATFTGWSALRDGAVWWLVVTGLPLAWIFFRVVVDVRECRVALVMLIAAAISYIVSVAAYLGYVPVTEPRIEPVLVTAPLLFGHWLIFAGVVSYARFVVLDAQGLVTVRRNAPAKRSASAATAKVSSGKSAQPAAVSTSSASAVGLSRETLQTAKTPADASVWVDGSRQERERYDDEDDDASDGDRKLSKSDRKRLRKMKAQGRAA